MDLRVNFYSRPSKERKKENRWPNGVMSGDECKAFLDCPIIPVPIEEMCAVANEVDLYTNFVPYMMESNPVYEWSPAE